MIVGGLHASVEDAPTSSMFMRAGKSSNAASKKKDDGNSSMTEALTQAAVAISSALSPRPPSQTIGGSPGKLIESRSKCYRQLSDINNLKASGVLTEEEYFTEKESIMCVLRKL